MDAVTFFEISALQQMMDFLRDVFPWISLMVLLLTTLSVALAEKRRRKLVLERSVEQERIEALEHLGAEEKERLLRAAAPLPEIREAYPLPDLPLRLVSALAKVFGLLKILLLSGFVFSSMRMAANPEFSREGTHAAVMVLLLGVMIVLSVMQIAASAQVTRGGNKARRFLIFLAVIEFGGAIQVPGMPFEFLWRGIMVVMSAYTVWVLLLRKQAQSALLQAFVPTRGWQKAAVVVLCVLSLAGDRMKLNASASNHRLESSCSRTENHGITLPINRVVLQAGDDSAETRKLLELLETAFAVPAERVAFEAVPSGPITADVLYLLVSKTVDERNDQPKWVGGKALWNTIAKEHPEMAGLMVQANLDHKIGFNIQTPFSQDFFVPRGGSNLRHVSSPSIRLAQSAEYSGKGRDAILADIAGAVAKTFNQSIRQRKEKALLRTLPGALLVEPEPLPAPDVACMEGAAAEAGCFVPEQQLQLYRLGDFSAEGFAAVSNQLVAAGWRHAWDGRFDKGTERITLRGHARYAGQHALPYLHLIHASYEKAELPESFAADFCREQYGDFIELFQAKAVPPEVLYSATLSYLETPDLSAPALYSVYERVADVPALETVRQEVLLRFARELLKEPLNDWTFELHKHLAAALSVDHDDHADVYDRILALYGERMVQLELERDTNGMQRATATVPGADRPLLILMRKPADDASESGELIPFYLAGWVEVLEDGSYRSHCGTPRGGNTTEGAHLEANYTIIHDFLSDSHGSSYGAVRDVQWVEQSTKPGDLGMIYDFSPQTFEMSVTVLLNDGEQRAVPEPDAASDLELSHTLEGTYLLEGKRLTRDELADALLGPAAPAE